MIVQETVVPNKAKCASQLFLPHYSLKQIVNDVKAAKKPQVASYSSLTHWLHIDIFI